MKVFLSLVFVAAVALAEPPSNRQQQYFFARQQDASSGPYPPRGWKPEGPAFNLPERQRTQPQIQYGAPQRQQTEQQYEPPATQPRQQYGAPAQQPQQQYGAPEEQDPLPRQQAPSTFRSSQFTGQQAQSQIQQAYGGPAPQQAQQGYDTPAPQQAYGGPASQQAQQGYDAPAPRQGYGAPSERQQQGYPDFKQQRQVYEPPQSQIQYGQPDYPTTTEVPYVTDSDESVTEAEPEVEQVRSTHELQDEEGDIDEPRSEQQQQERGEYFVALPDGRLQRVRYVSRQDLEEMAYFAKIRAENVEPLRGPIYAYAPLRKLEVSPGSLQVQSVAPVVPLEQNRLSIETEARPQKLVAPAVPRVEIKPLAQVQYQLDNPAKVVPLSSSYTTFTNTYGASAQIAPVDDRFILAINP